MNLSDPVSSVPLIGESYAKKLARLEIKTVGDLLYHVPRRYVDYRYSTQISSLKAGETATVRGEIVSFQNVYTKTGKLMQVAALSDGDKKINVLWFNQPYIARAIPPGTEVSLSGKVSFYQKKLVMFAPEYEKVIAGDTLHTGRLISIYPETAGVSSKWLRSRIRKALLLTEEALSADYLSDTLEGTDLKGLKDAIVSIHFPASPEEAEKARERLAFDELLKLQVEQNLDKIEWRKKTQSRPINPKKTDYQQFEKSLPFTLTDSQKRAIEEIFDDLKENFPMNRLLEGDVGSGKTVVAAAAIHAASSYGVSVVMAPTQLLASQHYTTLQNILGLFGIKVALVTGAKKDSIKDASVIVGTHALISKKISFENVSLIVIDEQHKFGVKQRGVLVQKGVADGQSPNVLTMTATPIPRTIALTLYGDLDISTLDSVPLGRRKVTTWIVPERKRKGAYSWLADLIDKRGIQAFIVCPLVEESEDPVLSLVASVKSEVKKIKTVFPKYKIGLLHGKMKPKEKEKVLKDFRDKKYDILVTTPIIEVGIDIPNAAVVMIETAERYGLAQLHQIRGRVGRGVEKSYCLLMTSKASGASSERLKALTNHTSGRELAEIDLKLRGVGEIFGIKQSGAGELKIASWTDIDLIRKSKELATQIVVHQEKYADVTRYFKSLQKSEN